MASVVPRDASAGEMPNERSEPPHGRRQIVRTQGDTDHVE